MGDRYFLEVTCPKCKFEDKDVYFAPTCGFSEWKCPECGAVVDLEEFTGITKEAASNRVVMEKIAEDAKKGELKSAEYYNSLNKDGSEPTGRQQVREILNRIIGA